MTDRHAHENERTRRAFLGGTAAAAGLAACSLLGTAGCADSMKNTSSRTPAGLLRTGDVILFQGDSITDAGRDRAREGNANDLRALGSGYALLATAELLATYSGAGLTVYNRGISGNKVFQLAERWDKDCIAPKPDILSILIGVNDIWHTLNGNYDGTVAVYERDYRALLDRTRRELPEVRLVICEPFVLRCGAVSDKWFPEFDRYRAAARRIAGDLGAAFIPFQSMFDLAAARTPPAYWAADGVHPTLAGSHLMAQAWLRAVCNRA